MRWWDPAELERGDAEPWGGPLSGAMRPFSTRSLVRISLAGATLYALTGVGAVLLEATAHAQLRHPGPFVGWIVATFGVAASLLVAGLALPPRNIRRYLPGLGLVLMMITPLLVTWGVVAAGPLLSCVTAAYLQAPLFAFYTLLRRWAVCSSALVLVSFGTVVVVQDGWASGMWAWVAACITGTSVIVGIIAARADELALAEHEARVELAGLNRTLEERVAAQVAEIERLGGLRRFLSPQVADAVLSGDAEQLGAPHRRRIAVFFCDLRGFTAFTNGAEPEEVVGVLEQYYRAVGGLLQRYDATVGDYAGDGVMAYFGDPVPRDDAAAAAVEMAHEVVAAMRPVVSVWRRRGFALDYGIGLAYGYATLGVVGFDGRYDYKPVGGVVNLAARLCARAAAGQVLLDQATYAATCDSWPSEHVADLDLKGYGAPIRAYAPRALASGSAADGERA